MNSRPPWPRPHAIIVTTARHAFLLVLMLAMGKLADFAVLDRDLFDHGQGPIGETHVTGTFIEGVAVHETPDLGG